MASGLQSLKMRYIILKNACYFCTHPKQNDHKIVILMAHTEYSDRTPSLAYI